MIVDFDAKARAYGRFFETITKFNAVDIRPLVTEEIRFRDPFNDVTGVDNLLKILEKMFEDADDVSFTMREQAGSGTTYFLRWHFTCRPKTRFLKSPWQVDGISTISLTEDGLVKEHIDYWDAAGQFYEKLPIVGGVLRVVKRPLVIEEELRGATTNRIGPMTVGSC